MKLHYHPFSPFARKVTILAELSGLTESIELVTGSANLMLREAEFRAKAPSGQVPALELPSGITIFDSPVICEYLTSISPTDWIGTGDIRWRNLTDQSIGDMIGDAALQLRYESGLRPEPQRWDKWHEAWESKILDSLAWLEARPSHLWDRLDVGVIAIFCALAFVSHRVPSLKWRAAAPAVAAWYDEFAQVPAVKKTDPY